MIKYKYLPHTADVKFVAYGKNLEECFVNCLIATINIMTDSKIIKKKIKKKINICAKKLESLLFDFINELIFLIDVDNFIPSEDIKLKFKGKDKEYCLECSLIGDNYKNYEMHGHVKAATYHNMEIKKTNKGYEAVMVLDV